MTTMTYTCEICRKTINLPDEVTLDDLKELRLLYGDGSYWHIPCSNVTRTEKGIELRLPSQGKLVR